MIWYNWERPHVEWILTNLAELNMGFYPDSPPGLTWPPLATRKINSRQQARFIPAAELAAEMTARLSLIGDNVAILLAHYMLGEPIYKIARDWQRNYYTIERELDSMVTYLCGSSRKTESYEEWLRERKRNKGINRLMEAINKHI